MFLKNGLLFNAFIPFPCFLKIYEILSYHKTSVLSKFAYHIQSEIYSKENKTIAFRAVLMFFNKGNFDQSFKELIMTEKKALMF